MHDYKNIEHNFKNSDKYESAAIVQNSTRSKMLAKINLYGNECKQIMNLGVRGSKEISQICTSLDVNSIDILDICIPNNLKNHPRVNNHFNLNFDYGMDVIKDNSYDLVFSNMSLQWSKDFNKVIENISKKIIGNGMLAFSVLLDDNFMELESILRVNQMHSHNFIIESLSKNGLENIHFHESKETIKFDSFRDMIKQIRDTGVTSYTGGDSFTDYSIVKRNLKSKEQFSLTYHVGIFLCTKGDI
jgi:malonyl-CoA O-methyltransferase